MYVIFKSSALTLPSGSGSDNDEGESGRYWAGDDHPLVESESGSEIGLEFGDYGDASWAGGDHPLDDFDVMSSANINRVKGDWEEALARGYRLYSMLQGDRTNVPQSQWTSWDDLASYGWVRLGGAENHHMSNMSEPIYWPVSQGGLGAPKDPRPLESTVGWCHNKRSEVKYRNEDGDEVPYKVSSNFVT